MFGRPGLLLVQGLNRLLPLGAGLFGGLPGFGAQGHVLGQAGEGALFLESLAQQRRTFGVSLLCLAQGDPRCTQLLFQ
ncbi:hypothetical protein D3C75_1339600 [compost metagenome]